MRIFLVLICSFALASLALGAQEQKKKEKKSAQAEQVAKPGAKKAGKPAEAGKPMGVGKPMTAGKPAQAGKPAKAGKPADAGKPAETGKVAGKPTRKGKSQESAADVQPTSGDVAGMPTVKGKGKGKGKQAETGPAAGAGETAEGAKPTGAGKKAKAGTPAESATTTAAAKGKPFKAQKFNLPSKAKPDMAKAPAVKFQENRRIAGSERWTDGNYKVFRDYRPVWRDRSWYSRNYSRIVFVFGGWYYWNAGWWYPAWGYDPGAYYFYDGPIYAYNNLPPDQVIANVQAALQAQGYYHGQVDGLLGPLTRAALVNYQRDHGLYQTAAIDRPTLRRLGMA